MDFVVVVVGGDIIKAFKDVFFLNFITFSFEFQIYFDLIWHLKVPWLTVTVISPEIIPNGHVVNF